MSSKAPPSERAAFVTTMTSSRFRGRVVRLDFLRDGALIEINDATQLAAGQLYSLSLEGRGVG